MELERELSTFPLAPQHLAKLTGAGFLNVTDLKDVKATELSKELKISNEDALEILREVFDHDPAAGRTPVSALDMLRNDQEMQPIITFSERLDEMLGGGVPLGKITEFCGAPGIGKTQMCMQLSVDVQIPTCFGGLGGEAVYIDTEGSLIVERLVDIANAAVEHCHQISNDQDEDHQEALNYFTMENILSNIYIYRCHDYVELLATIHLLPEFIKAHSKVRLLIVDSVAFHFRHDFDNMGLRTRLLTAMAQSFIRLAAEQKMAVVLTNQMTTRFQPGPGSKSQLVPALGESWGHASTLRVILYWEENQRYALLYKSPSRQETTVPYQITVGGIRDMADGDGHNDGMDELEECNNEPQPKRQKVS